MEFGKQIFLKLKDHKKNLRDFFVVIIFVYLLGSIVLMNDCKMLRFDSVYKETVNAEVLNQSLVGLEVNEEGVYTTTSSDSQIYMTLEKPTKVAVVKLNYHNLEGESKKGKIYYITEDDSNWNEKKSITFSFSGNKKRVYFSSASDITSIRLDFEEAAEVTVCALDSVEIISEGYYRLFVLLLIAVSGVAFWLMVCIPGVARFREPVMIVVQVFSIFLTVFLGMRFIEIPFENSISNLKLVYRIDYLTVLLLVWILLFAVTNHTRVTNILFLVFTAVYGIANAVVYNIRGVPVQPQDLASISAAKNVASEYEIKITASMYQQIQIFVIAIILSILLSDWKIDAKKIRYSVLLIYVVSFFFLCRGFAYSDWLSGKMELYSDLWDSEKNYQLQGVLNGFLADAKGLVIETPENYSIEEVEGILEEYGDDAIQNETTPNIIVIMNESFSDMSVVGDFDTNIEYLPYWDSLEDNVIRGDMFVSVWGGHTVNTEFEFLTGNSMAFLPTIGYSYIKGNVNSIVTTLSAQGYKTIGMHPYAASGYNRSTIYKYLDFDETYFIDDFDTENCRYIRNFISDESDYDRVIEEYEKSGDTPVFIFNVTMQNHGSYASGMDEVKVLDVDDIPYTNEYLSLIKASDEAFETLIEYFENQDEETIILMFGDHQPAIETSFYESLYGKSMSARNLEELQRQYEVPFLIWANYDIPEADGLIISPNYLASYLLDVAGLKMTAYNRYLLDLYEEIPVINANGYIDNAGVYYGFESESIYSDKISEYNMVQYYNMFDKKHSDLYFTIR
jgi:phosphoglycerol transferase MdoB-like AlkP superfamily enzyme